MNHPDKKVAIIGGGIAGLYSAYRLNGHAELHVFEKSERLGGHTDTHTFELSGKETNVDSGFIVFSELYYPHFVAMLKDLGVSFQTTDMSFSAYNPRSDLLYNATNLNKLFCQRRNLLRPNFYRMIFDIVRFYHSAEKILASQSADVSVEQYLRKAGYSKAFLEDHLYPMISALWSATSSRVRDYPIVHLVDFMRRHGMMKIFNRPPWRVVSGGSSQYIEAIAKRVNATWHLSTTITSITRNTALDKVVIKLDNGESHQFDAVVLACHSDQALSLLSDATTEEQEILGAIRFQDNHVVVHTDEQALHSNKHSWASWNTYVNADTFESVADDSEEAPCTAIYWMNLLQSLDCQENVFVSLNPQQEIDPSKVLKTRNYAHPIFDRHSVAAQKRKNEINGLTNTYFAGAYWGWGFHEDGARSAHESCELLISSLQNSQRHAA